MIKTIKKQHWNRRGETLAEILVALLIIALSAAMFATMYFATMNIDLAAQKQDKQFYESVEKLEKMIENAEDSTEDVTVHYHPTSGEGGSDVQVEFFTHDGMSAYGEKPTATPDPGAGDTP